MKEHLDHRHFIASLPADTRRALCTQSDGPAALRLGLQLALIAGLGWAILAGVPGWPLLLVPQGILLVFLFTALHEAVHRTPFRTGWANDAMAWLTAFVVLLGPNHFRYFHMAHHRFTHDPERDPELEGGKPDTLRAYAIYLTGIPEWIWRVRTLVRNAFREITDSYVPDRGHAKCRREARIFLAGYVVLALVFGEALFWVWLLPMLLGGPFLRAYLLAEHSFCPNVADMFANTRTTFTTRAVRWLAWNMPYHAEHHTYPAVPFHKLPQLHALTSAHLKETADGYTRFTRAYPGRARHAAAS